MLFKAFGQYQVLPKGLELHFIITPDDECCIIFEMSCINITIE